jgi:hypothetical protein
MRVSKEILAEQAKLIIQGGLSNPDTELDLREIILFVEQAFGSVVKTQIFQNRQEGIQDINGQFIYSFVIPIGMDARQGLPYSVLPANTLNLPYDQGVYDVSFTKDRSTNFKRVPNNFLSLTRGLKIGGLGGNIGFYVEGNRLYYVNLPEDNEIEEIMVKLVSPIQGLDDNESVEIPLEIQEEIVKRTVQMYGLQHGQNFDEVNDNVKTD